MNLPLISIITPCYNCENFIEETIKSVINQTYSNWELLIQDDCSTDKSYEIAIDYSNKDSRIKVEKNKMNLGESSNRNSAIKRSRGEYLAFLDSDDLWLPHKLEHQLKFMQENDCDFSFTRYEHIDEEGKTLGVCAKVIKKLTYKKLLYHCWPGYLTVMYKQNIEKKIYAEPIRKEGDHALFLRVIKECKNAMGINECLALYRIRNGSLSRNKFKMIEPYITVVHDFEGKSLLYSYFCVFTHLFVKIFFKYEKIKPQKEKK